MKSRFGFGKITVLILVVVLFVTVILNGCGNVEKEISKPIDDAITITEDFINNSNLSEGGYVGYSQGKYYYSDLTSTKLYMCDSDGKNTVCIDDKRGWSIISISAYDEAVFYLRSKHLDSIIEADGYVITNNKQLCKYSDNKTVVLSNENVYSYAINRNFIFYSTADLKVYRMKHDGSGQKEIYKLNRPMNVHVSDDKLYLHNNKSIICADIDGSNDRVFDIKRHDLGLAIVQDELYYIDAETKFLMKTDEFKSGCKAVVSEKICGFNIHNGKIIYSKFALDPRQDINEIVMIDLDGNNRKVLGEGTNLHVVNGHLIYIYNYNEFSALKLD